MKTNGTKLEDSFSAAWQRVRDLPEQVESGFKTHPLTTAAAIAAASFAGGILFGSRVARAVLVAATPVIVQRVLAGPLGDDLARAARRVLDSPIRSASSSP
jgi:hypothetical protein